MKIGIARGFARAAAPEHSGRQPTTRPFSIRLSESERRSLEEAAGSAPLGTYVRARLLGTALPRGVRRRGAGDFTAVGKILGLLGRSGLPSGLADLGTAARAGTIDLTPELEAQIASACADVGEVRRLLFWSFGLSVEAGR